MKWLIGLIVLLGLCAFLPQIASTSLGKVYVTHMLHQKTHAKVTVGSVKFSWFGPQVARNVQFEKEEVHGLIKELNIESPFWNFFFSIKHLKISSATVDLGKAMFPNGNTLAVLLAILNAPLTHARQVEVWFAPVDVRLEQGILTVGRLDALLASTIHLCTWGQINLITDQLDMTLGIPASTLQRAFGISQLPSDYVLKLPVRGTLQSPEIEKGAAAAKIGALVAAPKQAAPLIDLFSKKLKTDVPPPKRPYPWEK